MGATLTHARHATAAADHVQRAAVQQLVDQARAASAELDQLPVDRAERTLEDAWRRYEQRWLARQPKGRHGQTPRCEGCNQFVTNPNAPHDCGWTPGQGWSP